MRVFTNGDDSETQSCSDRLATSIYPAPISVNTRSPTSKSFTSTHALRSALQIGCDAVTPSGFGSPTTAKFSVRPIPNRNRPVTRPQPARRTYVAQRDSPMEISALGNFSIAAFAFPLGAFAVVVLRPLKESQKYLDYRGTDCTRCQLHRTSRPFQMQFGEGWKRFGGEGIRC